MSSESDERLEFESELESLSKAIAAGREKKIDLIEFMQNCTVLFEKIEICLRQGSAREKEQAYRKLADLDGALDDDIAGLCSESGKTEEEISAYIENPDNFKQDVWLAIQKAHRQILSDKGRKGRKKKPS